MRWLQFRFSWLGYVLAGFLFFGAVAIMSGVSHDNAQYALKRAMRNDMSWSSSSGRIEIEKLRSAVGAYLVTGSYADRQDLGLQLAIVKGRVKIWTNGAFGRFLSEDERRTQKMASIKQNIGDLERYLAQKTPNSEKLLAAASNLTLLFRQLGTEAHQASMSQAAATREKLEQQQATQRLIVEFMILLGALLLIVTIRQNAKLKLKSKEAQSNAEKYAYLAKHDPVTGLPNRTALEEEVRELSGIVLPSMRICVLVIDLDGFKRVNDMFGHMAGDSALRAVSKQLMSEVGSSGQVGTVTRVGGDEFIIILRVKDDTWSAEEFAKGLLDGFVEPLDTDSGKVNLGLSIGLSEARSGEEACVNLLLNADLALTEAKLQGKRRMVVYRSELRNKLDRREAIEAALKTSVEREEIHIAYQPIHKIGSGDCVGFEALARWEHPDLGAIGPHEFIPIAETTGDIVPIGSHVLKQACKEAASWKRPVTVSVNLSIAQILRTDIVGEVKMALAASGLEPERLKLEITESVLISDLERTEAVLKQVRSMGVRIALDDFGTGYSGLSYLTCLSWDEIKIDRSFVHTVKTSREAREVVELVIKIASQLGAAVTIEGIETDDERDEFANFGCHFAQGYLFGRPGSRESVAEALDRRFTCIENTVRLFPRFGEG